MQLPEFLTTEQAGKRFVSRFVLMTFYANGGADGCKFHHPAILTVTLARHSNANDTSGVEELGFLLKSMNGKLPGLRLSSGQILHLACHALPDISEPAYIHERATHDLRYRFISCFAREKVFGNR